MEYDSGMTVGSEIGTGGIAQGCAAKVVRICGRACVAESGCGVEDGWGRLRGVASLCSRQRRARECQAE